VYSIQYQARFEQEAIRAREWLPIRSISITAPGTFWTAIALNMAVAWGEDTPKIAQTLRFLRELTSPTLEQPRQCEAHAQAVYEAT